MKENGFTQQTFTEDLEILTGFRTVVDSEKEIFNTGEFDNALSFIREHTDPRAYVNILENQGERVLLLGNQPVNTPDVLFLAHVDVVSGDDHQFTMKTDGDIVYGRGVSDMKFSIPLGYGLLNQLMQEDSSLTYMLAITTDEERGGFKAAKFLAEEYQMRPRFVIVPDGGDGFVLINKFKGVRHIKITVDGKPSHSSRPWDGDSAVESLIDVLHVLLERYKENNHTEGWHMTVNPGKIQGGDSMNRLAKRAEVGLDFRFPESVDPASIDKEILQLINERGKKGTIEVVATGAHGFVDANHPIFTLFKSTMEEHVGRGLDVAGAHGSNDGRHFSQYNIPFLMTKPEGGDIHGNNEHISISSSVLYYHALLDFLRRYEQIR